MRDRDYLMHRQVRRDIRSVHATHDTTTEHLVADIAVSALNPFGQPPRVTVTGAIYGSRSVATRALRHGDVDCRSCGALHEDIAGAAPSAAGMIRLHLSDATTGEPMHAVENAVYWWQKANGTSRWEHRATLTRHLRVPEWVIPWDATEEQFRAFVESLRPVWLHQLRSALRPYRVTPEDIAARHAALCDRLRAAGHGPKVAA